MSIGALFTLCCIVFGLEDHDPENIVVADLFLGLFFSGLFNVMYSKKVKFVDIFGYFAGVCVTTIPSAIALRAGSTAIFRLLWQQSLQRSSLL